MNIIYKITYYIQKTYFIKNNRFFQNKNIKYSIVMAKLTLLSEVSNDLIS